MDRFTAVSLGVVFYMAGIGAAGLTTGDGPPVLAASLALLGVAFAFAMGVGSRMNPRSLWLLIPAALGFALVVFQ